MTKAGIENITTWEDWLDDCLAKLAADLPEEGIQRTRASETHKGYDTDGYGAQWVIDRLNAVLGLSGWRAIRVQTDLEEYETKQGRTMFEVTLFLRIEIGVMIAEIGWVPLAMRDGHGGHASVTKADALKGAFTNALKKTAAMFGVGAKAYRGELDDDHRPRPEAPGDAKRKPRPGSTPQNAGNGHRDTKPANASVAPPPPDRNAQIIARMAELSRAPPDGIGKEAGKALLAPLGKLTTLADREKALALLEADFAKLQSESGEWTTEGLVALGERADMQPEDIDSWCRELYGRPLKDLDRGMRINFATRLEEAAAKLEAEIPFGK